MRTSKNHQKSVRFCSISLQTYRNRGWAALSGDGKGRPSFCWKAARAPHRDFTQILHCGTVRSPANCQNVKIGLQFLCTRCRMIADYEKVRFADVYEKRFGAADHPADHRAGARGDGRHRGYLHGVERGGGGGLGRLAGRFDQPAAAQRLRGALDGRVDRGVPVSRAGGPAQRERGGQAAFDRDDARLLRAGRRLHAGQQIHPARPLRQRGRRGHGERRGVFPAFGALLSLHGGL